MDGAVCVIPVMCVGGRFPESLSQLLAERPGLVTGGSKQRRGSGTLLPSCQLCRHSGWGRLWPEVCLGGSEKNVLGASATV